MKTFWNIVIFLGLIALVGLANKQILGISLEQEQSEAVQFDPKNQVTQVLFSSELAPDVSGYGGAIPMVIGLDDHAVVKEVIFQKNSETPEFFKQVLDSGIMSNWIGKDIHAAAQVQVDAVSGATMSSEGIIKTMNQSLNAKLGNKVESTSLSRGDWIKALSISVVGILALLSFLLPKRMKPLQTVLAIATILVLGIWQGALLSVAKISSWLLGGMPSYVELPLLGILLASLLIPALTGKNFYCYHLCPFGAAQDLVNKGVKLNIKVRVYKWLGHVRVVVLVGCFLLLMMGLGSWIANVEPFSAFKPEYAPLSAVVIFVTALVVATFIPRAWCRFFCPCGAFLDLFKGVLKRRKQK